jgi:acetyltransferase-like isoleucine patch superfamily enzyme
MQGLCIAKGIEIQNNIRFNGIMRFRRYPQSSIKIGSNCVFNSSRNSVGLGLFKPCTLVTLERGAVITIGNNVGASSLSVAALKSVTIGNNVMLGANTTIVDSDLHNVEPDKRQSTDIPARPVIIEDNVFIGFNCFILKGVVIGENSVIGANSVVLKSIPPNSIALGNPCNVLFKRNWKVGENPT